MEPPGSLGAAAPSPPGSTGAAAPSPPRLPATVSDAEITSQATMRMARHTGGVFSLPTTAWAQDFSAPALAVLPVGPPPVQPADVAVHLEGAASPAADAHEVPTGSMPLPGAGRVKHPSPWLLLCRRKLSVKADAAQAASREYRVDEHRLTLAQLAARLETHVDVAAPARSRGLSRPEAARRLAAYGPNRLTPPPELPEVLKFARQFTNLLIVMLIVAAALAFLGWGLNTDDSSNVILAGTLCVVIVITCCINYWHERATSNVLASIKDMLPTTCTVVRDGHEFTLPAEQLVIGDLVHLKLGNRIPADLRLIASTDLKIEMSSLTGESDAVTCSPDKRSDMVTEARNIVFNSSLVMSGDGRGVVVRTGDDTYIGAIAGLAGSTGSVKSSMEREIEHVALYITLFAGVSAIVLFVIALARGYGFTYAIVYGFVLVLVGNVPEGLPTTVVTVLALTAQRMAEFKILIKRTDIIETLGAASVICTDKTGTLTLGKMSVENVWVNKGFHSAGKVRTLGGGGGGTAAGSSVHRGASMADAAAKMTIGRQMSLLADGTMVIHSSAPTPQPPARGGLPSSMLEAAHAARAAGAALAVRGGGVTEPAAAVGASTVHRTVSSPLYDGGAGLGNAAEAAAVAAGAAGTGIGPLGAHAIDSGHMPVIAENDSDGEPLEGGPAAAVQPVSSAPAPTHAPAVAVVAAAAPAAVARAQALSSSSSVHHPPQQQQQQYAASGTGGSGGGGGGGIDRSVSLARQGSYASFYTFQGLSGASWARSNAFTRLVTIAAICNRAQFAYEGGDDEEDQAGVGGAAGAAGPGTGAAPTSEPPATRPAAKQPLRGPDRPRKPKPKPDDGGRKGDGRMAPGPEPLPRYRGDSRRVLGDASEAALLRYVDSIMPIFELKLGYTLLHDVPFDSVSKTASAIVRDPDIPGRHLLLTKGAPEKVLEKCSLHLYNGVERPIDDDFRTDFQAAYERFALLGERVLGFAYASFAGRPAEAYRRDAATYPQSGLVFAGLISLVDPPKPGVEEAIDVCRDAYMRVTMVTGDHPLTAEAIARKVGIITLPTAREVAAEDGVAEEAVPLSDERVQAVVISGYALGELTPAQWDTLLAKEEVVFARTTPQQKLLIVEHYQRLGQIVAVTGDGTNDSPALKKANIGIAMGSAAASDVAREAADILIMDDNFASIVHAVEMGRLVFDNLRKSIAYSLAHAVPEVFPIFLTLAFGLPLALPGLLILTIDLITEQCPAISLSYEPAESDIMARPPRNMKTDRLVDGRLLRYSYGLVGVAITLFGLLSYFTVFASHGVSGADLWNSFREQWQDSSPPLTVSSGATLDGSTQKGIYEEATAAYYFTLIACQGWHVFTCKTRVVSLWAHGPMRNPITLLGVGVAIFVAILFIYVVALHQLFQTQNLGGYWFLPNLAFGALILTWTEYSKSRVRLNPGGWWARNVQW